MTAAQTRLSKGGVRIAEAVPLAGVKKLMAKHMMESHSAVPAVTIMAEFRVDALVELRAALAVGPRSPVAPQISYTHVLVKAVAASLREHRWLNSTMGEGEIQILEEINVGVATSLSNGDLVVPVIRHADEKSLSEIAVETANLVDRAKLQRLAPGDVRGGTFTVSNIGIVPDTRWQTPIVNFPQCAILALGAIRRAPVIAGSDIIIGHVMSASLSFDHRIVSGHPAALFLKTFDDQLQNCAKLQENN
jgi:pyruvate dehydrogenase E2 component (dihydrolipoamide acetyltransferase)